MMKLARITSFIMQLLKKEDCSEPIQFYYLALRRSGNRLAGQPVV
jgi:hypothetical protein